MIIRTYTELSQLPTLEERYEYLRLAGQVGEQTFGFERYLNQDFYRSREWQSARQHVIVRDLGYDLGTDDLPISGQIFVHHMNPITKEEIIEGSDNLINPEYLITCSFNTHNAIHYGDKTQLPQPWVERRPGDTKLWGRR